MTGRWNLPGSTVTGVQAAALIGSSQTPSSVLPATSSRGRKTIVFTATPDPGFDHQVFGNFAVISTSGIDWADPVAVSVECMLPITYP